MSLTRDELAHLRLRAACDHCSGFGSEKADQIALAHHTYISGVAASSAGFGGRDPETYRHHLEGGGYSTYLIHTSCCCGWTSGKPSNDWREHLQAALDHLRNEPTDLLDLLAASLGSTP